MQDITIKNFRCYGEKSMAFLPGINLLVGDNSVGKTSLLRACNLVNNAFFSGFSDENTVWKSADDDDFREVASDETLAAEDLPVNISFHLGERDLKPIILRDGSVFQYPYGMRQEIEKKSRKNARNLVTGLKTLKEYASTLQSNSIFVENGSATQRNPLPVYAYFTTEDIHSVRKLNAALFKKYPQKPSFGYYESADSKGLLDFWIKRLLVLREANKGEEEIANVQEAIRMALGADGCNIIRDVLIRPNVGEVYFVLMDGREVKSGLLSDGYRRLVGIVTDVAIRCALLNKTIYGAQAFAETHGTVIIDEIDEHQHPSLQLRVLKALHTTFPKVQFIVSTHSPLVISSVEPDEDNVVYKLAYNSENQVYTHEVLNSYGMDASTIIAGYMDQSPRAIAVKEKMDEIHRLIDEEHYDDARVILDELKAHETHDPEFTHLETMISFLNMPAE